MHSEHPIHQQGQLAISSVDAEEAGVISGINTESQAQTFTLDHLYAANPSPFCNTPMAAVSLIESIAECATGRTNCYPEKSSAVIAAVVLLEPQ